MSGRNGIEKLGRPKAESEPRRGLLAVIGTYNWIAVTSELFRRAGITTECQPDLPGRLAILRWAWQNRRKYAAYHHVRGANLFVTLVLRIISRKKQVWHWIGTDVTLFKDTLSQGGIKAILMRLAVRRIVNCHLCDSPGLQGELRHLGVDAAVVRLLPARIEAKVEPLPVLPAVLSYWHSPHRAFYNASMVFEIARRFPAVPFMIVGDNGDGIADVPGNIRFLGPRIDMDNVYSQITVYLRFPEHDSLSAMVLEVLARGRYVIYNHDHQVSGVCLAHDIDTASRLLKDLLIKCVPNHTGAEFVRRNYSLAQQSGSLLDAYIKLGFLHA